MIARCRIVNGSLGPRKLISQRFFSEAAAPVFPWRSSTTLLDRLETPNDLSGAPQTSFGRWIRMASVGRHFRGSVSDLIFGTWKQPLADDMGWAFQKGLAGLLSHHLSGKTHIQS